MTARAQEHSPIGWLLLDIFLVFTAAKSERMFSRELVGGLLGCGERPWADLRRGKLVTEMWLAQQLRPNAIRPKTIRIGEQVAKAACRRISWTGSAVYSQVGVGGAES